ncbi:pilus assembly protein PilY [Aquabacterium olei]|uniref:Pilus assembly protein PilY n=1 Tax=Aquabacterium olei TaxID=1296669 RepID=A0A2U8FMS4_9BURK|nr:PilC/PilY family type IV pilus protein [Aquabacterium olei]AWI52315.1 pilus assembly protein PilY [Aquabacterium olei]
MAWHPSALRPVALCIAALWPLAANTQLVISDTLTGATSAYLWRSLGGACLTAGTYASGSTRIPGCNGHPSYSGTVQVGGVAGRLPDPVGQGALRLTNGDTVRDGRNSADQTGSVVSDFTFPSSQGLQVTFTSVTYGGNGYGGTTTTPGPGADGLAFFLMDGSRPASDGEGAYGGSLGYSCSNNKYNADGVRGGYIGLGIDEFGNFSNPDDTSASGPGFRPRSIVLRGGGSITWGWLNASYSAYYPSWLSADERSEAVRNTCKSGKLWDYDRRSWWGGRLAPAETTQPVLTYPHIARSDLPSTQPIANQQVVSLPTRGNAIPITYSLKITQNGRLSLSYSYNGGAPTPVLTDQAITASNGPLPSTFRFGFSASTGGGSNVHEITCFKAEQMATSSSSAGVNAQQASRVQAGTQVYLAYYHATNNWGQLTANSLLYDSTTDSISLATTANWDAHCVLTGGTCQATGGTTVTAQGPSSRALLTWNGTQGIPFQWTNLTTAQRTALTAGDATATSSRLSYLRGDRSQEITASGTGTFRTRTGVLGDIQNASPTWVGPPTTNYPDTWRDRLTGTQGVEANYSTFQSTYATRPHVVYAGSNDGWLHGFRAGANDAAGNFSTATTANDGREVLGYMPAQVLNTIHSTTASLSYASPSYIDNAYVDATPGTGEIFYKGAWRTWLVGGLGGGGNATGQIASRTATGTGTIYALDVTNPANFSEANAASLVIGEWTSANLTCANVATGCGNNLGNTYGTPIIRRLHNGEWALIFGNGRNSANGVAGIFVVTFNATSGAPTVRFLSTGYGPSRDPQGASGKNGIAFVSSADLDGDRITDYIYAGDVFGYVWRFDLTSSTASDWAARSTPVFSTGGLPITTRVNVSSALSTTGAPRVILNLGTGQVFPQTATAGATHASGTQYLFGVWDADMTRWNDIGTTARYAALTGATAYPTVAASELVTQTITAVSGTNGEVNGYRAVSRAAVCWRGSTVCGSEAASNNHMGWRMALPGTNEQVVFNPVMFNSLMVVNTLIPAVDQPLSCTTTASAGFTMAVQADTGAAPATSFFNALVPSSVAVPTNTGIGGVGLNGTGSPSFVTTKGRTVLVQQNNRGTGTAVEVTPSASGKGKRVNWIRLR